MRKRLLLPLFVCWPLAAAGSAHAAVPIGGDGTLRPRDGAELLEAVDLASVANPGRAGAPTKIVLGEGDYEVDRPIVLGTSAGISLEGEGASSSTIVGVGAATTLLQINGSTSSARGIGLEPTGPPTAEFPAVQLSSGARLENFYVFVPEELPKVTAVEASGTDVHLVGPEIESLAERPAVRSTGDLDVSAGSISGGSPTLDLSGASAASTTRLERLFLTGGETTASVLYAATGSGASTVELRNSIIGGGAEDAVLLDLAGASAAAGSQALQLTSSTLSGAPDSTALRVTRGSGTTPPTATLTGLLSLGSATAVDCAPGSGSGAPTVAIAGIYRDGALPTGPGCAITESGRRSGGDPALTTARGLAWGSPAIDAIAEPRGLIIDALFGQRTSIGPNTPAATPTDIGAVEYQYLPPSLDAVSALPDGADGAVRFSVEASDGNEGETDQLTITWHFPDGETATGATAVHTFRKANPGQVTLTGTDPSGLTTSAVLDPAAAIQLVGPPPGPVVEQPAATTPAADAPADEAPRFPQQTLPEIVPFPKATGPIAGPRPESGAVRGFTRMEPRASRIAKRGSGIGAPRAGEAAARIELDRAANLTVTVRRREGTRLIAIPNARFSQDTTAGTTALHLTARIGTAALRPGLYGVTIVVRPASGLAERRDLNVRILR